jgi:hypothetical protein
MLLKKINFFLLFLMISFSPFVNFESKSKIKIGIISDANYCGEREVGWRIKIAAEQLGWEVFLDENKGRNLKKQKNLDWIICLLPNNRYVYKNCPTYLTIFHPFAYLEPKGKLKSFYEKYDGYLLTINQSEEFKNGFKSKNKQLFSSSFYPTLQYIDYKEVPLNNLMTMIPVWGNRLIDEKFKKIYKTLSQSRLVKFYGVHENKDIIEDGYMGKIPFDGVSVIEVLQKHGIVLIFHSDIHNGAQIPSSRIFEAAAASTVIISDENEFVKKHFGDTIFYVDTSVSAEEICLQIQHHMDTIRQNPQVALEMAKKAHQIFTDNFSMDNQLLNMLSMHNEIKKHKKTTFFWNLK